MRIKLDKIDFIKEAILDTQATIRAIDVKVAALLAGLLVPIASIKDLLIFFDGLSPLALSLIFKIFFIFFWVVAILAFIRTIGALNNPENHILKTNRSYQSKGTFYGGSLFSLKFYDVFKNRDIKSKKCVNDFILDMPNNKNMENELAFEQMKLIYIREIKLIRLKYGIHFLTLWLGTGLISLIWGYIGKFINKPVLSCYIQFRDFLIALVLSS